ncbi:uncharacterized protein SPPG_07912 [Spizellomyces punctatus DAOM BR117]|uniref:Uncharacterized protein n=1 Tax=Spizellomyces punctatus (strain DAOM BR117) TaxID=645134 RepID=A0A0L0H753_SPIPD|nr:uncharacterized protein SPPG_07912 [Spizellomyces punctatus DAOM BR117]KNC96701.1 hypothetical protein SPPG_07912 [Spizellomyces punctatus DAOM BR117]|eukprot:XP_016604741.1 hypothetical protein SPPG_07912 [Spizellomyces punctatus DAOM BR117]
MTTSTATVVIPDSASKQPRHDSSTSSPPSNSSQPNAVQKCNGVNDTDSHPTKRQSRRRKYHYLKISISPPVRGALPGYDGDRRVEWAVCDGSSSLVDAAEKTREALVTLRTFWNELAPEELNFEEFAWCVFGEDLHDSVKNGDDWDGEDLTPKMAARLAGHNSALSGFLADVRDWDAFRLMVRRRAGRMPMSWATRGRAVQQGGAQHRDESSDSAVSSSSSDNNGSADRMLSIREEAVKLLASEAFMMVLAEKEAQWDAERAELENALANAEGKVQRIVHSITGTLGEMIIPQSSARPRQRRQYFPDTVSSGYEVLVPPSHYQPSTSSRRNRKPKRERSLPKKVSFDQDAIRRDEGKIRLRVALEDVWGDIAGARSASEDDDESDCDSNSEENVSGNLGHLWEKVAAALDEDNAEITSKSTPPENPSVMNGRRAGTSTQGLYKLDNSAFISTTRNNVTEEPGSHDLDKTRTPSTLADFLKPIAKSRASADRGGGPDAKLGNTDGHLKNGSFSKKLGNLLRRRLSKETLQ